MRAREQHLNAIETIPVFVIYGTDAPIYHYPIVTGVMVMVNCFIHWMIVTFALDASPYYLHFGDGLHPLQWLTHNFLHGGPMLGWPHLLFNMMFLWPFGLIVEGKIGWARMLVLYLAIGVCQGFTQQVLMLPTDPRTQAEEFVDLLTDPENPMSEEEREDLEEQFRNDLLISGSCSLGSSAIIFGLLAICAIWAPLNEFESYFRWSALIRASDGGIRDWTVLTVCGMFVAKEFGMFLLQNGAISSAALHLNGFVVGGAFGLAMLYFGLVDCEGFDLISVCTGQEFKAARTIAREQQELRAELEAAGPKGPPRAIVPAMPHVIAREIQQASVPPPQPVTPIIPPPSDPPPVPLQPVDVTGGGFLVDPSLPEFDDAVPVVDPIVELQTKIEAMIAKGKYVAAVRSLAKARKHSPEFIVSAPSISTLAEGLIDQQHIKPALTVLSIGVTAYPVYAPRWQIRAATIELSVNQDPIAAIKHLRSIDKEMLDQATRAHYLEVAQQAKLMALG